MALHRHYLLGLGFLLSLAAYAENDPKVVASSCAAANTILATQMANGPAVEAARLEAERHSVAARSLGVTQKQLDDFVGAILSAYKARDVTLEEIRELAGGCASL